MTKEEIVKIKATFPWTYSTYMTNLGCTLKIVDKNGNEVDLGTLVRFVCWVSQQMKQSSQ